MIVATPAQRLQAGSTRVLSAVTLVSAIAPLSGTMVLVVLPDVQRDLRISAMAAGLLVATYLVAVAILQPFGGRLGDVWGRERVLSFGLGIIIVASVVATTSPNYTVLLIARLLQAAGGALAFPNAMALVRDRLAPARLGHAMGMVGGVMVASGALGVPVAEAVRALGTWRAVFVVSALHGCIAVIAIHRYARRGVPRVQRSATAAGIGGRTMRRPHLIAVGALTVTNISMYAFLVAVSLTLGRSETHLNGISAILLFLFFSGSVIGAPLGGHASDRMGRWRLSSLGLAALALGVLPIALTGETAVALVVSGALTAGIGAGAASGALQAAALEAIPTPRTGQVAGIISSGRYLGAALGSGVGTAAGAHTVLGACTGLAFVTLTAALAAGITAAAGRTEHGRAPRLASVSSVAHSRL